ncbi:MAG TPA: phospholipid scramblase-related protein, partial [Lacunisphaera sp.]
YDLIDPDTKAVVGIAQEKVSGLVKFFRLLIDKSLMPARVEIATGANQPPVLVLRRNVGFLRKTVTVADGNGVQLGFFKSKIMSLGGGFLVFSPDGQQFADVKGDWKGWNFKFLDLTGKEMGLVTKKWAGLGKELFTSADNYIVEIKDGTSNNALLVAAAIAIDTVFKEKK